MACARTLVPAWSKTWERARTAVSSATSTSRMTLLAAARFVRMVIELETAICRRLLAAPNSARREETVEMAVSMAVMAAVAFAALEPPTEMPLKLRLEIDTPPKETLMLS